jgi:hypothetical protein
MGEWMIVNFDGSPLVTGSATPDEVPTAEVRRPPLIETGADTPIWV